MRSNAHKLEEPIKVMITDHGGTDWYSCKIDEEFIVTHESENRLYYLLDLASGTHSIYKGHCVELIKPESTLDEGRKYDDGKPDWSLIPLTTVEDVVKVLTFGAKKYERDNWQGISSDRYLAAAMRHITAYQSGEKLDEESGLPHLAHAQCCLLFMAWKDTNQQGTSSDE